MRGDTLSRMTDWRLRVVRDQGTPALNAAMDEGRVTALAAFRAARYLSPGEQDRKLAESASRVHFSHLMADIEQDITGRSIRATLTPEEWQAIKAQRRQNG